ncbi:MAG: SDR family NAD(P)-dependent oxidoreductase [Rubrobacteraceae bacterium]|nr:SDR family NAD(P)-dependent oxidoreductase [Rubrobacteraceae bacterium]
MQADAKTEPGRVWFITGCSSGFGRAIAEAALSRGDTVVGTARRAERLEDLVQGAGEGKAYALSLDVTEPEGIRRAVEEVLGRYGRIDVLVNNAGHGQVGAVEETTEEELREIFDVHLFGPAALTRAVLPVMREQRSGAIVQMSSFGGQVSYPGFSAYCATKFALEGFSEALAAEVAPMGIKVLIVEPGAFRTSFSGGALVQSREMPEYEATVVPTREMITGIDGTQPGDPAKAASAILTALDSEETPLRLPLGADAVEGIRGKLEAVMLEIDTWEEIARVTSFEDLEG